MHAVLVVQCGEGSGCYETSEGHREDIASIQDLNSSGDLFTRI